MSLYDRAHFAMISFVHETLYKALVDPYRELQAAGLTEGQQVLEVGCGPGFFTIPAAEIVGEGGHVAAIDINAYAVRHTKKKVAEGRLKNVEVTLADASSTGLPDSSIDVAFLFGVVHALDLKTVLPELYRVLKPAGFLLVEARKSSWASPRRGNDPGGPLRSGRGIGQGPEVPETGLSLKLRQARLTGGLDRRPRDSRNRVGVGTSGQRTKRILGL